MGLVLVGAVGAAGPAMAKPVGDAPVTVTAPDGTVHPVPKAAMAGDAAVAPRRDTRKGHPPIVPRSDFRLPDDPVPEPTEPPERSAPAPSQDQYFYATAYQFGQSDGAWGGFPIPKPALSSSDYHSLGELAVMSADSKQIIEVGYTVDRASPEPHLFIYHWVDGVGTCYNYGCGFRQVESTIIPGEVLAVNSTHQFMIQHFQGNWWLGDFYNWFGYLPDSLWNGTFTKAGQVQWFGEVAAASAQPCTDMGNGLFADPHTQSSAVTGIGYWNGPSTHLDTVQTNTSYYTALVYEGNNVRYGGPGAC